jgi:Domain of unknown function (DUF4380)
MKPEDPTIIRSPYESWEAYRMDNGLVKLHIVPEIGGRVIQYSLGEKDFFWINPGLKGCSSPDTGLAPDAGFMNYGGDKLWPAPQGWSNHEQWPGPPDAVLDGQPYRACVNEQTDSIHLTSRDDPRSGIRFSRNIRLYPNSTRVSIEASMLNIDSKPRRWGIWGHTQLDAGVPGESSFNSQMRAWCPINPKSCFEDGYDVIFGEKNNPSFKTDLKRGLMQVDYHYRVGKIGLDSHAGWVATVDGRRGDVFVQRFTYEPDKDYPDDSSVEFWHNGLGRIHAYNEWTEMADNREENPFVFESEVLSPFAALEPNEQYTWCYEWYACAIGGDYPVTDCNDTGLISEPLQARRDGAEVLLTGRFGVFCVGHLDWEAYDMQGLVLSCGQLKEHVTPLEAVVLKQRIKLPESVVSLALIIRSSQGQKNLTTSLLALSQIV